MDHTTRQRRAEDGLMSIYVPPRLVSLPEKAIIGPGAAAMMTLSPLAGMIRNPQQMMRMAQMLFHSDRWVYKAEQTIDFAFSTVDWHLEDGEDNEIETGDTGPAGDALRFMEKPQEALVNAQGMTRAQLWSLTTRHAGLCGSAFWLADQVDMLAKTPKAALYINPARMTPAEDDQGNLTGWVLDYKDAAHTGIPLDLDEVFHFKLNEPDTGHFGIGNVEAAHSATMLTRLADTHAADVLQTGGRLTGIVSAKAGGTIPDNVFQQLVRDFRTVADSGDAAKRVTVVQGPIDFTRTVATPLELSLIELMKMSRDDTLAHWGVPLSQIGGTSPSGLNSGDTRKYDRAALWQNAIHPRLFAFWEVVQYQILDRWQKLGVTVELEIEEPEFDDDSPRYDLLAKSVTIMMSENERRALIGADPIPPEVLGPNGEQLGETYWLPVSQVQVASLGAAGIQPPSPTQQALGRAQPDQAQGEGDNTTAQGAAGETSAGGALSGKAKPLTPLHSSLKALRANMDRTMTPKIQTAVLGFLKRQRGEIAARLRSLPPYRAKDPAHIWPAAFAAEQDTKLTALLRPHVAGIADAVSKHVATVHPSTGKAGPMATVTATVLKKGAARVTAINATTRDAINAIVADGIEQGLSMTVLADAIEAGSDLTPLIGRAGDLIGNLDYRAEMIARTETGTAYNEAAMASYRDAGIEQVQVLDGDEDDICSPWSDVVVPIDEEPEPLGHPNCTRAILPWIGDAPAKAVIRLPALVAPEPGPAYFAAMRAAIDYAERPQPAPIVNVAAPIVNVDLGPLMQEMSGLRADLATLPAPIVNVAAPVVNVAAPIVNVPPVKPTLKVVKRDADGNIIEVREEEIN
jgi:phage portal protein BeeE